MKPATRTTKPTASRANTVGEVMGRYHPHGDLAIYMSLVRMAQDFSMSLPLIDGQGNFGSIDGDMPAAMRYTESRLAKAARSLLDDIDEDTVDFVDNYDGARQGAERAAGALSEPAGQWRRRHRRRHGHQYPAAQSLRSDRRRAGA